MESSHMKYTVHKYDYNDVHPFVNWNLEKRARKAKNNLKPYNRPTGFGKYHQKVGFNLRKLYHIDMCEIFDTI